MFSLLLAVTLSAVMTEEPASHDYTLAYKESLQHDKPLMVVVGAEWCPACNVLKDTTIHSMEINGELEGVSVAVVDRDAEPELAAELMSGEKMIPQIIVFSKNDSGGWQRRKLTGYQPAQPVRSLIRRAIMLGRG